MTKRIIDDMVVGAAADKKTLLLDCHKIAITEKGIPYFYWPIAEEEISRFSQELRQDLVAVIRQASKKEIFGVDAAIIISPSFIEETQALFYRDLLLTRAAEAGYDEVIPTPTVLPVTHFLAQLKLGPSGIKPKITLPLNYRKKIISTSEQLLASTYAKQTKEKVVHRSLKIWFRKLPTGMPQVQSENDAIIAIMIEALCRVWNKHQHRIPESINIYLTDWLKKAFCWINYYWQQLVQQPKKIPQRLWVKTSDDIWGRILARYVRKHGGRITRFDEKLWCGYLGKANQQQMIDFEDCDTYVTINKIQAEVFRESYADDENIHPITPQFIALEGKKLFFKRLKTSRSRKKNHQRPTILYMPTISDSLDLVSFDFIVRLLQKLRSWNFNFILNPYFSGKKLDLPLSIEYLFGSIKVDKPMNQLINEADVVLFDNLTPKLLSSLLSSSAPCVFLDFNGDLLTQEANQLITRRCVIVPSWQDEKNHAQVDWFKLRNAILESKKLLDDSFFQRYFSDHMG